MHLQNLLGVQNFHFNLIMSSQPQKLLVLFLRESALLEIAEGKSCRKRFKSAAKSVRMQTLRKQLGRGSKKKKAIPGKCTKQASWSCKTFLQIFFVNNVN